MRGQPEPREAAGAGLGWPRVPSPGDSPAQPDRAAGMPRRSRTPRLPELRGDQPGRRRGHGHTVMPISSAIVTALRSPRATHPELGGSGGSVLCFVMRRQWQDAGDAQADCRGQARPVPSASAGNWGDRNEPSEPSALSPAPQLAVSTLKGSSSPSSTAAPFFRS